MTDMLTIHSWRHMWDYYIVDGLRKGVKREEIRQNLIDAFRKEIFGQMMFRMKVDDLKQAQETPENVGIVTNIVVQARKKWVALIKMCNRYQETKDPIRESDLRGIWDGETEEEPEKQADGDERTAEWPELNETEDK